MNEGDKNNRKKVVTRCIIIFDIVLLALGIIYWITVKIPYKNALENYNNSIDEYLSNYKAYSSAYDDYFDKYTECELSIKSLEASKNKLETAIKETELSGTEFTAEAEKRIEDANSQIESFPQKIEKISLVDFSIDGLTTDGIIAVTEQIIDHTNTLKEEKVTLEMTTKDMTVPNYDSDIIFFEGFTDSIINPDKDTALLITKNKASDYDPFSNLTVSFSGSEPIGRLSIKKLNENGIDKAISFVADKDKKLSNGDTVTISIKGADSQEDKDKLNEKLATEFGQKISIWEKTYEVKGLSSYINKIEQLDDKVIEKMVSEGAEKLNSSHDKNLSVKECNYIGSFLLVPKKPGMLIKNNILYLLYEVTVSLSVPEEENKEEYSYIYCTKYEDILTLPDGKCTIDYKSIKEEGKTITQKTDTKKNLFSKYKFKIVGYETIEDAERDLLFENIEKYDYQENMEVK